MKPAFVLALLFYVFGPCHSRAQETSAPPTDPITITDSQSPDGLKDLVIRDASSEFSEAEGTVYVRNTKTGRLLSSFRWFGFGRRSTPGAFKVLWRPDNRAFTIKYPIAHGYIGFRIYILTRNGGCRLVHAPDLVRRVADKYGLEIYDKGGEHPTEWLSGNRLVVDEYNRSWPREGGGDTMQPYRVVLQLPRRTNLTLLRAIITRITPETNEPSL